MEEITGDYLKDRSLLVVGAGKRLNDKPTAFVVFNVCADLASLSRVTETIYEIVLDQTTHTHTQGHTDMFLNGE